MKITWKYLLDRNAKHAFGLDSELPALCGAGFMWSLSKEWKNDEEGLSKLSVCSSCLRILKKKNPDLFRQLAGQRHQGSMITL